MCVCGILVQEAVIYVYEQTVRVCVCVQKAPTGMNYLEESLLYLSTVDWPQARTILLLTTQETTLIHHPLSALQCGPVSPDSPTPTFPSMLYWSPCRCPLIISLHPRSLKD